MYTEMILLLLHEDDGLFGDFMHTHTTTYVYMICTSVRIKSHLMIRACMCEYTMAYTCAYTQHMHACVHVNPAMRMQQCAHKYSSRIIYMNVCIYTYTYIHVCMYVFAYATCAFHLQDPLFTSIDFCDVTCTCACRWSKNKKKLVISHAQMD
jgi:hypothetical protein